MGVAKVPPLRTRAHSISDALVAHLEQMIALGEIAPGEDDALADVLNLSRAMAYKAACAGLDLGGGKAVIIGDPATDKTEALLRSYGRFVQSLGGRYYTACDVGTYVEDMDVIARESTYVTGRSPAHGGAGDSSILTAYGVFQGMRAAAERAWGTPSLSGRRIGVAGVGKVGRHVAGAGGVRGGEQPARASGHREAAGGPRDPLCTRLRRELGWADPGRRRDRGLLRAAGAGEGDGDLRHDPEDLPAGHRGGRPAGGGGGPPGRDPDGGDRCLPSTRIKISDGGGRRTSSAQVFYLLLFPISPSVFCDRCIACMR